MEHTTPKILPYFSLISVLDIFKYQTDVFSYESSLIDNFDNINIY
jgi:hypothetical protein